jgi:N-dimethylarginine dimethylaminohydrolase
METLAPIINRTVLMSDAENFSNVVELNIYTDEEKQPDLEAARDDHERVREALGSAGIHVFQRRSPEGCQDGIYTANWAFCHKDMAIMANLPNVRQAESYHAKRILWGLNKKIIEIPQGIRYSGQGDTLPCGDTLFVGKGYRTDAVMAKILKNLMPEYNVVSIQTVPQLDERGEPVINKVSGWEDSPFYDIDLAMGVVKPGMIAWCPEAFLPESQDLIAGLKDVEKIEIDYTEATELFASNFISTGRKVVMGNAPKLQAALEAKGLETVSLETKEIKKGGGFIRCIALTIDND